MRMGCLLVVVNVKVNFPFFHISVISYAVEPAYKHVLRTVHLIRIIEV
jgi:hypothetical protein